MASSKTEVDKLDVDNLAPVSVDLRKLNDVVNKGVVKKTAYDKLATKSNSIDTSAFALKTNYDTDKTELEKKISDTSRLVKKTDYNTKITEIDEKLPEFRSLVAKTALTTVENKIPDISSLIKKKQVIIQN